MMGGESYEVGCVVVEGKMGPVARSSATTVFDDFSSYHDLFEI